MNTDQSASFDSLVAQAITASQSRDSDGALQLLARASRLDPSSGVPHFLIGAEYAQLGQMADAEAGFARAVLLAPDLVVARYQLGLLQFTQTKVEIAAMTWQPLLQLPDDNSLRLFVQGFLALARDLFDEALTWFEQGVHANRDNAPLNNDIQMVIDGIRNRPAAPSGGATSDDADAHFLISGYERQGTVH